MPVHHKAENEDVCDPFCYARAVAIKTQGRPSAYKAIGDAAVSSSSPSRQVLEVTKWGGFLHIINNVYPCALYITVFLRMPFSWTAFAANKKMGNLNRSQDSSYCGFYFSSSVEAK